MVTWVYNETMDLVLDSLPNLPQCERTKIVVTKLWSQLDVVALWVGGSLATERADQYSDVDLYVAVSAQDLSDWYIPNLDLLFEGLCRLHQISNFGREFFVHHLVLATGEVYDLHLQSTDRAPIPGYKLILGCREPKFLAILQASLESINVDFGPASPLMIADLIEIYWLHAHKHRKVLARNLDLVAWTGLKLLQPIVLRLYYILATGDDCGDLNRATIHQLTPVARSIQTALGPESLATIGLPMRSRPEIYTAIDGLNAEVSRIGRQLANTFGFTYPVEAEDVVIKSWLEYKQVSRNS